MAQLLLCTIGHMLTFPQPLKPSEFHSLRAILTLSCSSFKWCKRILTSHLAGYKKWPAISMAATGKRNTASLAPMPNLEPPAPFTLTTKLSTLYSTFAIHRVVFLINGGATSQPTIRITTQVSNSASEISRNGTDTAQQAPKDGKIIP